MYIQDDLNDLSCCWAGGIRAGELVRKLTHLFDKLESLPKEARNIILCMYYNQKQHLLGTEYLCFVNSRDQRTKRP